MRPIPIVSIAGDEEVHRRALNYNNRFIELDNAEADLWRAENWNSSDRMGIFTIQAPVPTAELHARVARIKTEMQVEYADIMDLAKKRSFGA